MIKITDACIVYEDAELFRHLTVSIEKGALACITGPSGCGKSSLLHAIQGLVPLKEGEIEIGGKTLTEENVFAVRWDIAWLPQELALPCEWVKEMVQLPFSLRAARKQAFRQEEFEKLLAELNLENGMYQKRVNEISGGQRQRLMIASAALLHRPVMLIDEPTSALDRESVECVAALLRRLAGEGLTILAVSHDPAFIERCDRIIDLSGLRSGEPPVTE